MKANRKQDSAGERIKNQTQQRYLIEKNSHKLFRTHSKQKAESMREDDWSFPPGTLPRMAAIDLILQSSGGAGWDLQSALQEEKELDLSLQPSGIFFVPQDCFPLCATWGSCRRFPDQPSDQEGRQPRPSSSHIPALPFPMGKHSHHQYMKRDLVPHGTKERSDNGGGRKAAARKGIEPNLIHLSLKPGVPGAVSSWW